MKDSDNYHTLHVMRALRHAYYKNEYEPICAQLSREVKRHERNKEKYITFMKTPLKVTMIVKSDDFPFYEKNYKFKSDHDDGDIRIITGCVAPTELESSEFYRRFGAIHEFYPVVNTKQFRHMKEDFEKNSPLIVERIKEDIELLLLKLKKKKELLINYEKT